MNRLLKERLIRFAEGNGFEAKTVLNADGSREAQLSVRGEVICSIPNEMAGELSSQLFGSGKPKDRIANS